jgi:hypothetical protein
MTTPSIERDERTTSVENAGYRWSYLVLSFGMLAIVAYRSFVFGEASGDLLGLVVLGGVVNAGYQGFRRVLYRRWVVQLVVTLTLAALLAAMALLLRH